MNPDPDIAVVQDSSAYHPKTWTFEINANGITGLKDDWQSFQCKRYESVGRDLLDCADGRKHNILHLDTDSGTFVEWLLMSGANWSSAVMSRGKCDKIGR